MNTVTRFCAACRQLWDLGCHLTARACFDGLFSRQVLTQMLTDGSWQEHTHTVTKYSLPNTDCSVCHHIIPFNTIVMMMTVQFACFIPNIQSGSALGQTPAFLFLFGLKHGKGIGFRKTKKPDSMSWLPNSQHQTP